MATACQTSPFQTLEIKTIALLSDFSRNAEAALPFAAAFARAYKAGIVLAHAYVPPPSAYAAPSLKLVYQALEDWRQDLENRLLSDIKSGDLQDIKCTTLLSEGGPTDLLRDLKDVDLIVVGTAGETGFRKAARGSIAEEVFLTSAVPVLTVGPHCHGRAAKSSFDTILYATDFSPGSSAALPYALSIASKNHAKLILLHVSDNDTNFSFEYTLASAEPLDKLHQLIPAGTKLTVPPTYVVAFGKPDTTIVEEAKKQNATIIVIGTRGASKFASLVSHFVGGTAYGVAANTHCPVLTVRSCVSLAHG